MADKKDENRSMTDNATARNRNLNRNQKKAFREYPDASEEIQALTDF